MSQVLDSQAGNLQVVQATVPAFRSSPLRHRPEEYDGGAQLRPMEFKSYEPVPPNVQQQIVDKWQKSRGHVEED